MNYKVAGIDIHKKVLMVVVTDAAAEEETWESRRFGTGANEREHLVAWLQDRGVQQVVMESTAQYWNQSGWIWSRTSAICIWRKRTPIERRKGASTTLRMRNDSPGD
jgi:hypothetical protein